MSVPIFISGGGTDIFWGVNTGGWIKPAGGVDINLGLKVVPVGGTAKLDQMLKLII